MDKNSVTDCLSYIYNILKIFCIKMLFITKIFLILHPETDRKKSVKIFNNGQCKTNLGLRSNQEVLG